MAMIDNTAPDANLVWEITENLKREIANEPDREPWVSPVDRNYHPKILTPKQLREIDCRACHWQNADTCRACKAGNISVVLAVNKSGIKGG